MTIRTREMLFATMPPETVALIRELVSYRSRVSVIAHLVPESNAVDGARQIYGLSDVRAPGGQLSACNCVLDMYRGRIDCTW